MAKYLNPMIIIPWVDAEGVSQRSMLKFTGLVDLRRLRRELTKFCKLNFNTVVSKSFLNALILSNIKTHAAFANKVHEVSQEMADQWLKELENEANQDIGDTENKGDIS